MTIPSNTWPQGGTDLKVPECQCGWEEDREACTHARAAVRSSRCQQRTLTPGLAPRKGPATNADVFRGQSV